MTRARETAEIIASHFEGMPVIEDQNLAEGVPEMPEPVRSSFRPSNLDVEV